MGGYFDYLKRRQINVWPSSDWACIFPKNDLDIETEDNACVHGWVTTLYESTQEVFLVNEKT